MSQGLGFGVFRVAAVEWYGPEAIFAIFAEKN